VFHHTRTERNLAVSRHNDMAIATNAQDCSGANQALLRHEGKS
jgi:hypothetical protein